MSRASAVLGSLVFFVLAPGLVSGLGPWLVSRWVVAPDAPTWWPVAAGLGGVLIVAGVAGGLYAWVRNPMYLANVAILFGQAAVFWRNDLVSYAFVVGGAMVAFVGVYEEPKLAATFGEQYAAYRSRVPGWWPRRPR
jgi:protein-S-isoprenylcysteine O-methyltransferase Ste14